MIPDSYVYSMGFVAQGLFSARLLVQWLLSEKAKKVVSPDIFWQLSIFASFLLLVYGIMRKDLVIVGGQAASYFIYIRNLKIKNSWNLFPAWLRVSTLVAPGLALLLLFFNNQGYNISDLIHNPQISGSLFTLGTIGQIVFTFRFVYQWGYSERKGESLLPATFWWISITGALLIIVYAFIRRDPVILLGQVFGSVIYGRNLMLGYLSNRRP